jgi:hypothetical protein
MLAEANKELVWFAGCNVKNGMVGVVMTVTTALLLTEFPAELPTETL